MGDNFITNKLLKCSDCKMIGVIVAGEINKPMFLAVKIFLPGKFQLVTACLRLERLTKTVV